MDRRAWLFVCRCLFSTPIGQTCARASTRAKSLCLVLPQRPGAINLAIALARDWPGCPSCWCPLPSGASVLRSYNPHVTTWLAVRAAPPGPSRNQPGQLRQQPTARFHLSSRGPANPRETCWLQTRRTLAIDGTRYVDARSHHGAQALIPRGSRRRTTSSTSSLLKAPSSCLARPLPSGPPSLRISSASFLGDSRFSTGPKNPDTASTAPKPPRNG